MYNHIIYILAAILCFASYWSVEASLCTAACDLEFVISPAHHICGTDGKDHRAPLSAIVGLPPPYSCYRNCGVDVLYPGTCACPNSCNAGSKKGKCHDDKCECEAGWGGADCSQIVCPNPCSGNGQCVKASKNLDMCVCNGSFTGADCSISTLDLPTLPYGQIGNGSYYQKDKYGDEHPIFNISAIANWNIEIDEQDFVNMMTPVNTYNQSNVDVKVHFSNGNINQKIKKTSMKLKGHFARLGVKKSFVLSFDDPFFEMEHIVLKAPSLDVTYLKSQLIVEYFRAMMVPAARASFATLTINGVFHGLYWMKEEIDEIFIKTRLGNHKGNFYVMSSFLSYLGDDAEAYKNVTEVNNGRTLAIYKEEFGKDESWSDFVQLAKFINTTTDAEFESQVANVINVDNFVRTMVVTSAVDDPDSYTRNGNNWAMYNNPKDHNRWMFVPKDFEMTMFNPLNNAFDSVAGNEKALLAYRLFKIPQYQDMFKSYYVRFLSQAFDLSSPNSAKARAKQFASFLESIIENDGFYRVTYGLPANTITWKLAVAELELFLHMRHASLNKQFGVTSESSSSSSSSESASN